MESLDDILRSGCSETWAVVAQIDDDFKMRLLVIVQCIYLIGVWKWWVLESTDC